MPAPQIQTESVAPTITQKEKPAPPPIQRGGYRETDIETVKEFIEKGELSSREAMFYSDTP
jgi:hypothetical protein